MNLLEDVLAATQYVAGKTAVRPRVGVVLGSGLGSLADAVEQAVVISSADIPGFCVPGVEGHAGMLVVGWLEGVPVAALRGRPHLYEGHNLQSLALHVWVMHQLGSEVLILTNASGALNPNYRVGDVMLLTDHINMPGLCGRNPLVGPDTSSMGPRFVDMGEAYDPTLQQLARQAAGDCGIQLREGVYVMVGGPNYETQAELRFLRAIGGDAVGMSTANETIAARQCGLRVLGLSGITNLTMRPASDALSHDGVLALGDVLQPKLAMIIRGVLRRIASPSV